MPEVRPLFKKDIQQLLAIEQSVQVVPWTADTFKTCFEAGHSGWVIEDDQKIISFIITSMRVEECHILNFCVARDSQRQGYGQHLLKHLLAEAKKQGIGIIYLEVRRSNTRAIALYEKMQFQQIGERKGYYPTISGNEDALIFARYVG